MAGRDDVAPRDRASFALVALRIAALVLVFELTTHALLRRLLFGARQTPGVTAPAGSERVRYRTEDEVELVGYWFPATSAPRGTVILFHGNADLARRTEPWARVLTARGLDVLAAEYRGYGESEGTPSSYGIELDARAALEYVVAKRHVAREDIAVHGASLGGAAALAALRGQPCRGAIIESTFASLHAMGRAFFFVPFSYVVPSAYALDNVAAAAEVDIPVLHLHGRRDGLIDFAQGEELDRAFRHSTFLSNDGDHMLGDSFTDERLAFFDRLFASTR